MIFVFYVWLDAFLLGWISMVMIGTQHCDDEHITYDTPCYYRALCVGCNNWYIHMWVCIGDMVICFFFMAVTTWPMIRSWINYCKDQTSNERFAKNRRSQSNVSDVDSVSTYNRESFKKDEESALLSTAGGRNKKKRERGCWMNCTEMCCNRTVISQDRLM